MNNIISFDVKELLKEPCWKKVSDKAPRYCCTKCNHLYNNKSYKYCPNCGKKMNIKLSK